MPLQTQRPTVFTSQQVLNRVFVNATSRLASYEDTGDNRTMDLTEQGIWNRVFDNTNSALRLSMQ